MKLRQFLEKVDIFPITAYLKFESENSFAQMLIGFIFWSSAQQISFLLSEKIN